MRASWEGSVTAMRETVVSSERILLLVFLQWARDIILVIAQLTPFRSPEPVAVHGRDFDCPGRRRGSMIEQSVSVAPA